MNNDGMIELLFNVGVRCINDWFVSSSSAWLFSLITVLIKCFFCLCETKKCKFSSKVS